MFVVFLLVVILVVLSMLFCVFALLCSVGEVILVIVFCFSDA